MYEITIFLNEELHSPQRHSSPHRQTGQSLGQNALKIFHSALLRGRIARVWGKILRRGQSLIDLDEARCGRPITGSSFKGIQAVAIQQIKGSEGRCADFDANFNPLQERTRDRWVGVARARMNGTALPPVSLVEMDGSFYVRDGHHRLSVARAFGQEVIDAEVTLLRVGKAACPGYSAAACLAGA